ncbi:DUF4349 domain-containing protein [Parvularcula sp. LCG005]|uniref:DUF4349 domain-containing protein n=1 Tax=Parvularcula sp. LCG005 TaxID=3078805 RepID=UPI002942D708|nr:DUF4349 domain-containing protein [Parvularcula sp. LCG005]WOI53196.1 DUF4349 domain-containing protein [Parvularcula sp. LCG005]
MKRILVCGVSLVMLAACDGGGGGESYEVAYAPAPMAEADSIVVTGSRAKAAPQADMMEAGTDAPSDDRQLAYEYNAELRLPAGNVGAVAAAHEAKCKAAGPAICQVMSSSLNEQGEDYVYARLQFRAAKSYMDPFRSGLSAEAEKAQGQLTSLSSTAEDLTRSITDTSARLEAQRDLRERLLVLLEKDTDQIGDLLQIERELARVQGEIESAESYLNFLKGRVSMDMMSVNYSAIPKAVTPQTLDPLKRAVTGFVGTVARSLAAVISFIAAALPWILIGVPVLWVAISFVRRMFRRRKV